MTLKKSELSFADGFTSTLRNNKNPQKAFDWDKAGKIIKDAYSKHKDLIVEAGLQRDWDYTSGVIFEDGKAVSSEYTYLSSNWAIPTMILSWDGEEQEEIECWSINSRFGANSSWDKESLKILKG